MLLTHNKITTRQVEMKFFGLFLLLVVLVDDIRAAAAAATFQIYFTPLSVVAIRV